MVFNNFGAPLYESFEGHATTSVVEDEEPERTLNQMQVALDEIEYDFDCSDKIEQNNKVYCRRHQGQEIEAFQDGVEEGSEDGGDDGKPKYEIILNSRNQILSGSYFTYRYIYDMKTIPDAEIEKVRINSIHFIRINGVCI